MTPGRPGRGEAGCRAGRAGRPVPRGIRAAAVVDSSAVVGRMGFINGGHLEVGVAFPPGAAAGPGACIARQSSAIAPALPCHACQACVARHGLAGSAPLSSYACPARYDPFPGRPRPPPGARRYPPGVQARPGGPPHPTSGARRYPPGVQARPGGPPRPPPGARRYPPGVRAPDRGTRTTPARHGSRAEPDPWMPSGARPKIPGRRLTQVGHEQVQQALRARGYAVVRRAAGAGVTPCRTGA